MTAAPAPDQGLGGLAGLDLRAGPGCTILRLRVTPKSSRNAILGALGGALRVRIAAPPVDGAANEEARAFLAKVLGRPKSDLSLERGASGREKVIRIEGLAPDEVRAALVRAAS